MTWHTSQLLVEKVLNLSDRFQSLQNKQQHTDYAIGILETKYDEVISEVISEVILAQQGRLFKMTP